MLVITFLWVLICVLFFIDFLYLVTFLRIKPRPKNGLAGLLSICFISLLALAGLLYVQVRGIDAFKSGSYYLFLSALFVEQVIAQWTLTNMSNLSSSRRRVMGRIRVGMTIFVIVFALFTLVVAIFHL